jgi:CubicO group peptidase (beta-lactamase class C family)
LLEKVGGQSYASFVRENIFGPLGMKDSGYDSNSAIIARRAAGYQPGKEGFPAANSNCAGCASSRRAGAFPLGHQTNRPFDSPCCASQNPWPSYTRMRIDVPRPAAEHKHASGEGVGIEFLLT